MQIELRDGFREVPDHLGALMAGLDTYKMTYEEAIAAANKRALTDLINGKQDALIRKHFEGFR